jgi:ribosome recycling factor
MSGTAAERMTKAIEAFGKDLGGFRTGRASASLVERVTVEHYGAITPLNQMAGISVPENTLLVIQPWDKTAIPAIEKALNNAQLGMTPAVDGGVIRLRVLDAAAVSLCMENDLPIVVFDLDAHENILKAVRGEKVGTLISKGGTR